MGTKFVTTNWENSAGRLRLVSQPANVPHANVRIARDCTGNDVIEAGWVDLCTCCAELPVFIAACHALMRLCSMVASSPVPTNSRRSSGSRTCSMVVGLIASHPSVHWSNEVIPTQARVRNRRISLERHTLAGFLCVAHNGNCGCSRNPVPPVWARHSKASTKNRMSLEPIGTVATGAVWGRETYKGKSPDRSGGGPPSINRAAVKVSHGGPPPMPHTCPVAIWCIQNWKALDGARLPSIFCTHMSMEITKKMNCTPDLMLQQLVQVVFSPETWKHMTKTRVLMCRRACSRARLLAAKRPSPGFGPATDWKTKGGISSSKSNTWGSSALPSVRRPWRFMKAVPDGSRRCSHFCFRTDASWEPAGGSMGPCTLRTGSRALVAHQPCCRMLNVCAWSAWSIVWTLASSRAGKHACKTSRQDGTNFRCSMKRCREWYHLQHAWQVSPMA